MSIPKSIPKIIKEFLRYGILVVMYVTSLDLMEKAYTLETAGKLTYGYAGIVGAFIAALTWIVKWHFHTATSDPEFGPQPPQYATPAPKQQVIYGQPYQSYDQPNARQSPYTKPEFTPPPQPNGKIDPGD